MSEPGTVAEEAAKLFAALEDWTRTNAGPSAAHFADAMARSVATDAAECRLCPVCTLIRALRATRPETVDHLLDASSALLAALRSALDMSDGDGARRSSSVERIDIG